MFTQKIKSQLVRYMAISGLVALGASSAFADTVVSVPGTADLYAAGLPNNSSCCNSDTTPAQSPVLTSLTLSSGEYLTFSTTGGASHAPSEPASPTADGDTSYPYNLTADYHTGISGPTQVHLNGLGGVFLGPTNPSGPAPAQFTGGTTASVFTPGLNQIFFIGDGLTGEGTGTGAVQRFYVPTGATRFYLGIIDDGGYYDNSGTIVATITANTLTAAVPEPSTWAMMILGLTGLGVMGYRRRDKRMVTAV